MITPEELYVSGQSIPEVSAVTGIPRSTLRKRLLDAGVLRSRTEGVRNASGKGRLGGGMRGRVVLHSEETIEKIRAHALARGELTAKGTGLHNGYVRITRGQEVDRLEHDVIMEARLGRKLLPDEVVHHIDENRSNNDLNNLALMTRAAHTRLHRITKLRSE
jgi:hypothetical protein